MRVPITAGIKKWDMFSRDATAASCAKKQAIQTRINKGTLMLLHTTQLHCFPIIVEFYSLTMSLYLCADVYHGQNSLLLFLAPLLIPRKPALFPA